MNVNLIDIEKDPIKLDYQTKRSCKILKFSSEWSLEEISTYISSLNQKDFPNLFVFIVEVNFNGTNEELGNTTTILKNVLLKTFAERKIILQISSKNHLETKFYYKENNFFTEIEEPNEDEDEVEENSKNILWYILKGEIDNFEALDIEKLLRIKDSETVIRIMRCFELSQMFVMKLIKKCSAKGTKSQLLPALDASFEENAHELKILGSILDAEGTFKESVLSIAVSNSNRELVNYITTECKSWICQLPFDHQVQITTSAFIPNQEDILCDLIEIADFPFPQNFKIDGKNKRLCRIVFVRNQLEEAIESEDLDEISKFVGKYPSIKTAYNLDNKSALFQANFLNKTNAYSKLKSFEFALSQNEEIKQEMEFNNAGGKNSLDLLESCSSIHNRNLQKDLETIYRKMIRKWYEDIYRTTFGAAILNAAAQCTQLRILFDFESETVNYVHSSEELKVLPQEKFIFFGCKFSDIKSQQDVKGDIIHELCHLVLHLIYENNSKPYYKDHIENADIFERVVLEIKQMILQNSNDCNVLNEDECNGIISSVYQNYRPEDFHPELIVRAPQILAVYDNDQEKCTYLRQKYMKLFDFWEQFVLPDLLKFKYDQGESVTLNAITSTFTLIEEIFVRAFDFQSGLKSNFDVLEVKNVPLATKGFELISQNWFKEKVCAHQNLLGIVLKVNQKIDESFIGKFNVFDFKQNNSIFIAFQSTVDEHKNDTITFWKIPGCNEFYYLFIDDDKTEDLTSFFHKFLVQEIKYGKSGILENRQYKERVRLHEIGDGRGYNLLELAILGNQLSVVKKLLEHDFDGDKVINMAWEMYEEACKNKNKNTSSDISKVILVLLEGNSRLPNNFEYDQASNEIQEFVKKCEGLHKDVAENKFDELGEKRKENKSLTHFYDRNNQSLLTYILKERKIQCLNNLDREVIIGCHETLDDDDINLYIEECRKLRERNKTIAKESSEIHLFVIRSKSRIGHNAQFPEKKWEYVDEAFNALNKKDYCRKIMMVAATFKNLKIFFDFKNTTTHYLDPASSQWTYGIIYSGGTIFIGARNLMEENNKSAVFGVLAHELCHLAVLVSFMNPLFDPFPLGESEDKTKFISEVMVQCNNLKEKEQIVKNVFNSYAGLYQISEMIVTVPQMLMAYSNDKDRIDKLKSNFHLLFEYSIDVVTSELERAINPLKILEDEKKSIEFEDLTEPMKKKIIHSRIVFQGVDTTFHELIGGDDKVLKCLSSDEIRNILLNNKILEISSMCKLDSNHENAVRSFIQQSDNGKEINFNEVKRKAESSRIMILSDHAGMGKTTIFKDFAVKLKKSEVNCWVSFISLKTYVSVFDRFKKRQPTENIDEVRKLLLEIVDQSNKFDAAVFTKLLSEGRVILLFDGADEICPTHTDILTNIFKTLSESKVSNQLWISTRPHFANDFSRTLKSSLFSFSSNIDAGKVVEKVLATHNIKVKTIKNNILQAIRNCFSNSNDNLANPLIIEIISKLWIESSNKREWQSKHGLYLDMIKMQNERNSGKILAEYQPPISVFSVWLAHQVFALKQTIRDDFVEGLGFKLDDLAIMKTWEQEKKKWTSDMIQRYGILTVYFNESDGAVVIEFIHDTYAEFFVASFLIDFLFSENFGTSDDEIERKFAIFDKIMSSGNNYREIIDFMFIKNEAFAEDKKICGKVKQLIVNKIDEIHENMKSGNPNNWTYFENYAQTISVDSEISSKLWKADDGVLVLKSIMDSNKVIDCELSNKITKLAELCFGPNWHEVFNKSVNKLITDEEIEALQDQNMQKLESKEKNLLKYCDLVNQGYDEAAKENFYENINMLYISSGKIRREIISRMKNNIKTEEFVSRCTNELYDRKLSAESVAFIFDHVEQAYAQNYELLRKEFLDDIKISRIINKTLQSNESGIFEFIKQFYIKFCSARELSNILRESNLLEIPQMQNYPLCSEYEQFIQNIINLSNL